jgi:hypothetical protein
MEVYEITGMVTGVSEAGVNYLQPADSFQNIENGFIYRQVLQSRQGVGFFAPRLADNSRIFGIFEHTLPNATKELLAFDQNFLYKFNVSTGVFDPIPFGGSIAAALYTGFDISAKDFYISGTSYPTKSNDARFVFTSPGIDPVNNSSLFFYDGTDVKDFTNIGDNPDYAAPTLGAINYADFVIWFNERLNLINPSIAGVVYNQGVLYSGIRNAAGDGDKFNVPTAQFFQADTYQNITGAGILGQILMLNMDRQAYVLEKTTDPFNAVRGRAVPGVVGTNAKFSGVFWDQFEKSLGKTGVVIDDGRRHLRGDNKIPNYTATKIDQKDFNLTYGGFDRLNNQFLWAYKISESDSDTQNAVLVNNYEEDSWSTYDQRFSVFGQTDLGLDLAWDDIEEASGNDSWEQWDTTEEIWDRIGLGVAIQKTLAGDDLGFIYELNQDYDDYFTSITNVTTGATTTLTVNATAVLAGDLVTIANVEGMTELNNFDPSTNTQIGDLYEVISATPTSIVINVDSTLFTPYTANTGTLSKTISFSAETIPFNPFRAQGYRVYVSHVEAYIESTGGIMKMDVFADQQTTPFKSDILFETQQSVQQSSEWVSASINQEANFITFKFKQQSPAVQFRMTSFRIHCSKGGKTSG